METYPTIQHPYNGSNYDSLMVAVLIFESALYISSIANSGVFDAFCVIVASGDFS